MGFATFQVPKWVLNFSMYLLQNNFYGANRICLWYNGHPSAIGIEPKDAERKTHMWFELT